MHTMFRYMHIARNTCPTKHQTGGVLLFASMIVDCMAMLTGGAKYAVSAFVRPVVIDITTISLCDARVCMLTYIND